jgi:hypothetical protein
MPSSYAISISSCASVLGSHVFCSLSLIAIEAEAHGHVLPVVYSLLFLWLPLVKLVFKKLIRLMRHSPGVRLPQGMTILNARL